MATYLAYGLGEKEMQVFCSVGVFSAALYLNKPECYYMGELEFHSGIPISFLTIVFLMFVFAFLSQLFSQKEKTIRRIFLLITYAVFLYEYIGPFVINWGKYTDSGHEHGYRYLIYIAAMAALVVLAIMAFQGKGGLKQINTDENTN